MCLDSRFRGDGNDMLRVQTGNIVYKINRIHRLRYRMVAEDMVGRHPGGLSMTEHSRRDLPLKEKEKRGKLVGSTGFETNRVDERISQFTNWIWDDLSMRNFRIADE